MARKRFIVSERVLLTWLTLAGFIILFAPQSLTSKFQLAFAGLFRSPLSVSRTISLSAADSRVVPQATNRREQQYRNCIANLRRQLDEEHRRVEQLTAIRSRLPLEGVALVPADIITDSIETTFSEFFINRGRSDGVEIGQFVLGDNSIVGTVCNVDARRARVRLFTDPGSRIEVEIVGVDVYRVMHGLGGASAKIPDVSIKHEVTRGDWVFVRKFPGLLDSPIIVGIVDQCTRDTDDPLVWDITIKPACDLERLNTVSVIVMNPSN
jgi:cell shape-determining protein MreC